ncbi:RNase adapter RapZ [Lentzea sp. BCCO 10_0061]|uniref:RNase adapter RapZ n=1 Tax=Lentzea sokolovensis TaxID=3095429 RepID=A0ABU4V3N1_9PSEU|nr:RNase adapter RapZ [Lentzea sp. BCCO 10_0061]MDX8146408.1 RNase adapter RapZ [Lentzea sp. BCCO 10_0061]
MKNTVSYRLISFGYLHNQPPEADLVFDVRRSLHDPAALGEDLAHRDGRDEQVQRVVMCSPTAEVVVHLATVYVDTMSFQDKSCVIAVGCSHGRHRSVALIERLAAELTRRGYPIDTRHLRLELLENRPTESGEQ